MNINAFYKILEESLPKSSGIQRKEWAAFIISKQIKLSDLNSLLFLRKEIASRYLWLLSDVGELDSKILLLELPFLLRKMNDINYDKKNSTFANYWKISGVPKENETEVINLLFAWLQSSTCNVITKTRSVHVLYKLTKSYPELKNELRISLEREFYGETNSFKKLADKVLLHL